MTEIATYHRAKRNFGTGFEMIDRIEELEAKLAKAVEALEAALKYNSAMHGGAAAYNQRIKDAIAELKGGKHE
jgi:hypothetical protein